MTSLLQFRGDYDQKGRVGLQFVLRADDAGPFDPPLEPVGCPVCGKEHERIHVAFRRPAGMFGPWVQFRYNGEIHVPDLSIPISVSRLPKDAVALDDDENARAWHTS